MVLGFLGRELGSLACQKPWIWTEPGDDSEIKLKWHGSVSDGRVMLMVVGGGFTIIPCEARGRAACAATWSWQRAGIVTHDITSRL